MVLEYWVAGSARILVFQKRCAEAADLWEEMLKSGRGPSDEIGLAAAERNVDLLLAVGPQSKAMADEAVKSGLLRNQVFWMADSDQAAQWLPDRLQGGDRVLVKGSRGMHMEKIVRRLTGEETN